MTLKCHAEFEEKRTCGLENKMRNLANFHQSTWQCFDESYKFKESLCVMTLKNDTKSEGKLTYLKIGRRNLTSFDSRIWKFQKFTL